MGECAEPIGEAVVATIPQDVPVASVAALRRRIEAKASAQDLAIDHHREEEQREIQQ